jgi:hypothetical protein
MKNWSWQNNKHLHFIYNINLNSHPPQTELTYNYDICAWNIKVQFKQEEI